MMEMLSANAIRRVLFLKNWSCPPYCSISKLQASPTSAQACTLYRHGHTKLRNCFAISGKQGARTCTPEINPSQSQMSMDNLPRRGRLDTTKSLH